MDEFVYKKRQDQLPYVYALRNFSFLPFRYNMSHYFSFKNNQICLQELLKKNKSYTSDFQSRFPLEFAITRKSYDCSAQLLEFIMSHGETIMRIMDEE